MIDRKNDRSAEYTGHGKGPEIEIYIYTLSSLLKALLNMEVGEQG